MLSGNADLQGFGILRPLQIGASDLHVDVYKRQSLHVPLKLFLLFSFSFFHGIYTPRLNATLGLQISAYPYAEIKKNPGNEQKHDEYNKRKV